MRNLNTLKDYVIEYKNGNKNVLNYLISFRTIRERNNAGQIDKIYRLKFNDKALHNIYLDILKKFYWIDGKDIDHFVLASIEQIFEKADVHRSGNEIIHFARKSLEGYVQNFIKEEEDKYYNYTKPEAVKDFQFEFNEDDDAKEKIVSLYDTAAFQEYKKIEDNTGYQEFIQFVGGIKNLLTESQMKLYDLIQDETKTQEQIAEEYGCSQENVSKQIRAISKRIKKEYIYFKTLKSLKQSKNTYHKINEFIEYYNQIIQFDIENKFDYFGYIAEFIKRNVNDQELKDITENYTYEDFIHLHKNKTTFKYSILDVLVDSINQESYQILVKILFNENFTTSKKKKDKFVIQVLKAFNTYIQVVKKSIHKLSGRIVEQNDDNYKDLIKKLS
ncbi:hypothetical protein [Aeribacillus composti]|uniref:hypothetical protein n=1 Tax=Aeribacillus composti TaxID=1868734 RepID=UPI003D20EA44